MIDAASLIGVRELNEDAYLSARVDGDVSHVCLFHHNELEEYDESTDLPDGMEIILVSDGMGGLPNGDGASFLTLTLFMENLETKFKERIDMTPCLRSILEETSAGVSMNMPGSGATIVGMITLGAVSWVFNIGDSKCILQAHNNKIRTLDHSFSERSNAISSYVGMQDKLLINIFPVGNVDRAILFSDGLNNLFDKIGMDIVDTVDSSQTLCELSVKEGSKDNVTCVIYRR